MASKHQCGKSNIVSFPNKSAYPERVADERYYSALRKINRSGLLSGYSANVIGRVNGLSVYASLTLNS